MLLTPFLNPDPYSQMKKLPNTTSLKMKLPISQKLLPFRCLQFGQNTDSRRLLCHLQKFRYSLSMLFPFNLSQLLLLFLKLTAFHPSPSQQDRLNRLG